MTNQEIAAQRFTAYQAEMNAFTFGEWATMTDVKARNAREAEIKERHGFRNGWMVINGESFDMESAFPEQVFPRFPADQGTND